MVKNLLFFIIFLSLVPISGLAQCSPGANASVTITLGSSSSLCSDENISINSAMDSDGGLDMVLQWQIKTGTGSWTDLSGQNASTLSYSNVPNNSRFRLAAIFCNSTATPEVVLSNETGVITVNPRKTGTVTIKANATEVCPGTQVTYSTTNLVNAGTPTYDWQVNGTSMGSNSTFQYIPTSATDEVTLFINSSVPCVDDFSSNSVSVALKDGIPDAPTSFVQHTATICPNTSFTFEVAAAARATEYVWSLPTGWAGTSTGTTINITSGAAGTGTVSVKAKNSCGESAALELPVTIGPGKPSALGSITGPALICPGEIFTFNVVNGSTTDVPLDYTWTVTGGTISSGQGTNEIQVTAGTGTDLAIEVFSTNSCEINSDTSSKTFSINAPIPDTPGTISGADVVCPNTSVEYSIAAVTNADSYIWTLDGTALAATGTTVSFDSGTSGTRSLTVVAVNECGEGETPQTKEITVDDGVPVPVTIVSATTFSEFCPGEANILFNVVSDARIDNYVWTVPSGWSIVAGQGTNEITVTAGSLNQDGNITLTASSVHCGEVTDSFPVTVKNPPPTLASVSIAGEVEVCHSATNLVYSVPAVEYATDYLWTVPTNWSIVSQETNQITVNAGTDEGAVTVVASNECGDSGEPITLAVSSVDGVPAAPGTITATNLPVDAICPPATNIGFSVPESTDAESYFWDLPAGWEITSGENTNSITVTVTASAAYSTAETVSVVAVNLCGNSTPQLYEGIAVANHVEITAGQDLTVCRIQNTLEINGTLDFQGSKLKIASVTSTGTGSVTDVPSGNVDIFSFKYTPSAADVADLDEVVLTVTTVAPTGACGPGIDEVSIFFKDDPTATIETVTPICEGQTAEVVFSGTPNTTLTYKIGTGTNQTIAIGETGTATSATGVLNASTTVTLVDIKYSDGAACTKTLTGSTEIVVNPVPTVEFSYGDLCNSATTAASPSFTNGVGAWETGNYTATGALASLIDSSNGTFIPQNVPPGNYTVTYTIDASGGCSAVPVTTEVVILEEVNIVDQPIAIRICEGGQIELNISATGDGLTYQWYKGAAPGTEITGATSANLVIPSAGSTDAGVYYAMVGGTAPCSEKTSSEVVVTVDAPILITTQPVDVTVCENSSANFTVDASAGGEVLNYQWRKNGTDISGANTNTLTIDPITSSDAASYDVIISGSTTEFSCGPVTSTSAILNFRPTPTVAISGTAEICDGGSSIINFSNGTPNTRVTFSVNGTGNQTITLDNSGEATFDTGALTAVSEAATAFNYQVITAEYTDTPLCSADLSGSDPVIITVNPKPKPTIAFEGDQTEFCTATAGTFTPALTGTGNITGGIYTSDGLTIDAATGAFTPSSESPGEYQIIYTVPADGGCSEVAASLDIIIYQEVQITTHPFNVGICSTQDAEFSVSATGDNLTYQWYKDGLPIDGATSPILSLPVATSENEGEYFVKVGGTNACTPTESTMVQSDPATLNIDENIRIIEPADDIAFCSYGTETVTFTFIAEADGEALDFTWVYADGTPVPNINGADSDFNSTVGINSDGYYEGTLTIENINPSYNNSYAVKINGPAEFTCSEAISNSFVLDVNPIPDPPIVEDVQYCLNDPDPVALTATGENLIWYETATSETPLSGAPVPSTASPSSYWVSQMPNVCESDRAEIKVIINDLPGLPVTEPAISYCKGETEVVPLSATADSGSLNWYDTNGDPLTTAPTPSAIAAGEIKYYVSQTNASNCEGPRQLITVTINDLPVITVPEDQTICEGTDITLSAGGADTYIWYADNEQMGTGADLLVTPTLTTTYTVIGTDLNGCSNSAEVTVNVDGPSAGGIATGPTSVCIGINEGTITLTEYLGNILRWEKSEDGTTWMPIEETTEAITFSNISVDTHFRAVVQNGVCDPSTSEIAIVIVDPLPVGGELAFDGLGRVIETCSNPGPDYNISLILSGQEGEIVSWRFKESSATEWLSVKEGGELFTGAILSPALIRSLGINESTIFEVEIGSGACTPNVFSQNATLSIVSSDIAPNPVTVAPGVVCAGDEVTLSSGTGYGTGAGMEAGAFDFSSITNKGWRIRDKNGTDSNFDSSADNGIAAIWLRTNPLPLTTANLNSPGTTYTQNWDSSAGNEGNKGFAIVSGPNPSTLETSIFNLFAVENPVLTFDQAYNLTPGSAIYVDISTDGGATYDTDNPLFALVATDPQDGSSGNYTSFGDDDAGPQNKMELDLTEYAGLPNLRIRFRFVGTRSGDVWAVDAISLPVEPSNVDMVWTDYTDPDNPVIIGTNNSEQWAPTLIGWNDFEIRTKLTLDSTGEACPVIENFSTIKVFVFDQYTSITSAIAGSCGDNVVQLSAVVSSTKQGEISSYPTADGYVGSWEVAGPDGYSYSADHFTSTSGGPAINDPNAIFSPGMSGEFTFSWILTQTAMGEDDKLIENPTCPPIIEPITILIKGCTQLDFDGIDDYVDLGTEYMGTYSIEAWIRPEEGTGTIISGPNFEINMEGLPASIAPNTRWYHIAVSGGKLYVDGIEIGVAPNTTGGEKALIGARWNSAGEAENHFSGWIEEVRIWNTVLTLEQIRFMMNQRLENDATMGVEIPMPVPQESGGTETPLAFSNLAGYYQLIATDILEGGLTADLSTTPVNGRLHNMESLQENTAPLPYTSGAVGKWTLNSTWTQPVVWDIPNANGLDGSPIEWNIVRTYHDITSDSKDITLLGLISVDGRLSIAEPTGAQNEMNTGQFLRLTHYLKLDGIIDLVGESQLLQDMGSIVDAASTGNLERDQQGTASSFNYNYWSSPVSIGPGNVDYTVAGVMKDGTTTSWQPITFGDAYAFADGEYTSPRKVSNYWLHKFHGTAYIYGQWFHVGSTGTLKVGEGYSMKGTNGEVDLLEKQNYTFVGIPNNGGITLNMGVNQNYLIGNPYPSAIDGVEFLLDNLSSTVGSDYGTGRNTYNAFNGTLYFWSHFDGKTHYLQEYIGGYAVYNFSGGIRAIANDDRINATDEEGGVEPQRYIPVGQAFFVNTAGGTYGGDIFFKNSQRIYQKEIGGESVFHSQEKLTKKEKAKEDKRLKIWVKFRSPKGYHRQLLATADPHTSNNFDLGYDAPLIEGNVEDMYWIFDDAKYVIQGVADFNVDQELPLGMKIKEEGSLILEIDHLKNIPDDMPIYIEDMKLDSIHNLRNGPYETTSEGGLIHDRFKIVFKDKEAVQEEVEPEIITGDLSVLYVNDTREVIIRNPRNISIHKVLLNNVIGQKIQEYSELPAQAEIKLPVKRFSSGVYIVKVYTENGTLTEKIILE